MGFRTGAYATAFSVEPGRGNFTKVRLAISRKNRDTGAYETEFSGYCMFIGTAHAKASRLKERDRIKLGDVDVTNTYDKESRKEYVNYKVFDFDAADSTNGSSQPAASSIVSSNPSEGDTDDNSLPF